MSTWTIESVNVDSEFAGYNDVVTIVRFNVTDLGETVSGLVVLNIDSEWLDSEYVPYSSVTNTQILNWVYEFLDSDVRVGYDSYISNKQGASTSQWYDR